MLVSKQADMKINKRKVGLRTENTVMNHMIKKWAKQGVYKPDVVRFEDDLITARESKKR